MLDELHVKFTMSQGKSLGYVYTDYELLLMNRIQSSVYSDSCWKG